MPVLHQTKRQQQCIDLVSVRVLKQLEPFQAHFTPTDWQLSPLNCCISPEGPLTLKKQAQTRAALCRVHDRASWVWHFTKINKLSIAILSIRNLKAAKLKAPVRWHLLLSDILPCSHFHVVQDCSVIFVGLCLIWLLKSKTWPCWVWLKALYGKSREPWWGHGDGKYMRWKKKKFKCFCILSHKCCVPPRIFVFLHKNMNACKEFKRFVSEHNISWGNAKHLQDNEKVLA